MFSGRAACVCATRCAYNVPFVGACSTGPALDGSTFRSARATTPSRTPSSPSRPMQPHPLRRGRASSSASVVSAGSSALGDSLSRRQLATALSPRKSPSRAVGYIGVGVSPPGPPPRRSIPTTPSSSSVAAGYARGTAGTPTAPATPSTRVPWADRTPYTSPASRHATPSEPILAHHPSLATYRSKPVTAVPGPVAPPSPQQVSELRDRVAFGVSSMSSQFENTWKELDLLRAQQPPRRFHSTT